MPKDIPPIITAQTGIMFGDGRIGAEFPTVERIDREHPATFSLYDAPRELFADWLVIAHDTRGHSYGDEDQRATDRTNYDAILTELVFACEGEDAAVVNVEAYRRFTGGKWHEMTTNVETAKHAGVAVLGELLCIAPCPTPNEEGHTTDGRDDCAYCENFTTMTRLQTSLADYPFLDEEAHSTLGYEAWCEYMGVALSEELSDSNLDEETIAAFDSNPDDGPIQGFVTGCSYYAGHISQHLHHYDGFSGEYGPDMLEIAARQVAWALMSAGAERRWELLDVYRRQFSLLTAYMIDAPWFVEPIDQDTRVSLTYRIDLEVVVDTADGTVHHVHPEFETAEWIGDSHVYHCPGVKVSKHRERVAEIAAEVRIEWPSWPS